MEAVEIATPGATGTQVIVNVTYCAVCHSDLHTWQGVTDFGSRGVLQRPQPENPIAMGHEIVGKVSALGPDAEGVKMGDQVIVYPWLGCGKCDDCLNDRDNVCAVGSRSLGFMQHGGFADVIVPHSRYLAATGTIDPVLAATYACSGVTVRSAIRKIMPVAPEQLVVVIGVGGLGLQAVAILRALTENKILVIDKSDAKRNLALGEGADHFLALAGDDTAAKVIEVKGGKVSAVLDFVNNRETSGLAFSILRKGGRTIQVGLYGGELVVPLYTLAVTGLSIIGSITGTTEDLKDVN
ncbi:MULTISPECIES: alcohol dehydrogenase catalytic domain-containing protein [unclassified Rhizobium]|uniref:alcohol dehydrogenase catalytic domain-containing protein n=1 Tax=unclassified Rhizobium TaxID=2613769 RepID=UPI001C5B9F15|nr:MULTISPECIES: alcohol dehydrogenase catalytic domain-containing protein [unclassified Rhizobium]QXZ87596.1 alcohol dehydrogenase catalytic domain-containing protein [Rhizobium sp. K1/93]QXZ93636.1 alcohol dehydrogenase catalytic domain-containing protein [Rhizobium sp. K15/93]QYA05131.1 alcohol dehydrogenase catalytic domain-containing protein [Rhizobium sp. B21/90]